MTSLPHRRFWSLVTAWGVLVCTIAPIPGAAQPSSLAVSGDGDMRMEMLFRMKVYRYFFFYLLIYLSIYVSKRSFVR